MLQNIENVDTPFLWVDLDRMEENIARLSTYFKERTLTGDHILKGSRFLKYQKWRWKQVLQELHVLN